LCGGLCTEEGCETGWEGGQRSPLSSLRATPPHPRTHPNSPTLQTPNPSLQTPTPHKQVVDSKQLQPLVRTQYMRTAFQIPFDATVRVSLDTNLGASRCLLACPCLEYVGKLCACAEGGARAVAAEALARAPRPLVLDFSSDSEGEA